MKHDVVIIPANLSLLAVAHVSEDSTLILVSDDCNSTYEGISSEMFKALCAKSPLLLVELVEGRKSGVSVGRSHRGLINAINQELRGYAFNVNNDFIAYCECSDTLRSTIAFNFKELTIRETCRSGLSFDYVFTNSRDFCIILDEVTKGHLSSVSLIDRNMDMELKVVQCEEGQAYLDQLNKATSRVYL